MRTPESSPKPQPQKQPQTSPQPRPQKQPFKDFGERAEDIPASGSARRRTILGGLLGAIGIGSLGYLLSGSASLPSPSGQSAGPEYRAATLAIKPAPRTAPPAGNTGWSACVDGQPTQSLSDLDLVIVIDTTASMGGVLDDVKANVAQLVSGLQGSNGAVRVGIVAYRDYGDAYVVKSLPLTFVKDADGLASLNAFAGALQPYGGGDWPEAMAQALESATSMNWRSGVPASVIVIADAPPHADEHATATSIAGAFRSKIPNSKISLVDTGSGGNALMREIPKAGGGQYVTYDGKILNSLYSAISGCNDN